MKKNTILVVSSDLEYVTSIECILATELDYRYSLEIITDKDYLQEYLKEAHKIDVLLIEDNMIGAFSDVQIVSKAFVISDKEGQEKIINKLDGAEGILRALGSAYLRASSQMGNITTKIIDVVSVSGGSGKTITALGTASQLSAMRKKVLYIDAENYQHFYEYLSEAPEGRKYFESVNANTLSDLSNCKIQDLDKEIVKGRFDYLAPFKGNLAKYQLNASNLYGAAVRIADENIYDYIVVEHGCIYDEAFFNYLASSEKIVLSLGCGNHEPERLEEFLGDLRQFSGQMVVVRNRVQDVKIIHNKLEFAEGGIPISEHVQNFNQVLTLSLAMDFGLYRRTAEAIM